MVREWIVKSGLKSVQLRKQPEPDSSEQNVLGMLKAGESVYGEFLFVRPGRNKAFAKNSQRRHIVQVESDVVQNGSEGLQAIESIIEIKIV